MKKKTLYLFVLVGAILIGGGLKAQAEFPGGVDAHIPFQFNAGGAEFPAGNYIISPASSADLSLMEIRSADGQRSALFETEQSDTNGRMKNNELIFNHVGDAYFLSEIVDADNGVGSEVSNAGDAGRQKGAEGSPDLKRIFGFIHIH